MIPPPAFPVGVAFNRNSYVYLLISVSTGKYYLGWTTDMQRRLVAHNNGESRYTKWRGPWELVGYEKYSRIEEAKEREKSLKRNPRMYSLFEKRLLSRSRHMVSVIKNRNHVARLRQVVG